MVAPALAALVGISGALLWRWANNGHAILMAGIAVTITLAFQLSGAAIWGSVGLDVGICEFGIARIGIVDRNTFFGSSHCIDTIRLLLP